MPEPSKRAWDTLAGIDREGEPGHRLEHDGFPSENSRGACATDVGLTELQAWIPSPRIALLSIY